MQNLKFILTLIMAFVIYTVYVGMEMDIMGRAAATAWIGLMFFRDYYRKPKPE
ncbi:hypothetical protein [Aneurinibacillus migulanus]|uniref:hypothetical protein n=1 Tax=Aneurinibacillus migulanus TaxID=47500 RepID=UPI000A5C1501|nr:hypothetical protein [Aneurinibacillus migulanus]